jgi:hypothetical protein
MPKENKDPIEEELSQTGEDAGMCPELLMLNKNRITSQRVLPPMEFLFTLFGEPCFPRRELVAFTGRAKSGKTFVMSMLMTVSIARDVLAFKRNAPPSDVSPHPTTFRPLRVLWYDTEQSDNSTQDILVNRIRPLYHRCMGPDEPFPEEQLDIFNVRNVDRVNRERYFFKAIEHYKPDLVILDGIRDLVADINDGTVAQEMMERLMKTAQEHDCCIVCVLHQNKSGDSRDPRGWLGTELLNKAYDVFAIEKLMPQRIFRLEQLYTRKYDIEQQLYFTVDDEGLPCAIEAPPVSSFMAQSSDSSTAEERPKLNDDYIIHHANGEWEIDVSRLFTDAFQGYDSLTGAALSYRTMTLANITSRKFYYICLDKAMQQDILLKTKNNKNIVVYRLKIPSREAKPQAEPLQQDLWQDCAPF